MDYKRLEAEPPPLRGFIVASAILCCFSTTGLAFGFSALVPPLLLAGAFHEPCLTEAVCGAQIEGLTKMFATTTSLLNMAALPSGALLDCLGVKLTAAVFAVLVALGCELFAERSYFWGFVLLGVSGPCIFNCTLSFGNLFPKRCGLITAALVGSFDASSAVFAALALLMDWGRPLSEVFHLYALLPAACGLMALTWPSKPVMLDEEEDDLDNRSVKSICLSKDFALLAYTVSVTMVCINFFIATVFAQLLHVTGSVAEAKLLNSEFAALLPAGGVVSIPLVGLVIDKLGPSYGYVVLLGAYGLFLATLLAFYAGGGHLFASVAFISFAFCRPLFYSLNPAFCGQRFGFRHFGTVFGLLFTLAGLCNLLVQPLAAWATGGRFVAANLLLGMALLSTLALPLSSRATMAGVKKQDGKDDMRHSFSMRSFSMRS